MANHEMFNRKKNIKPFKKKYRYFNKKKIFAFSYLDHLYLKIGCRLLALDCEVSQKNLL